ncbi:hypothetical protein Zmor_000360 [Zophobas morio]|uniref:Uncharacterized protein n=1 Tax=Zophobas morio TaxID=2755281 RepID=A0AA38IWJ5_9CUCU|nr:hypothetical protein Zmor_000360 [Zophobas morio]
MACTLLNGLKTCVDNNHKYLTSKLHEITNLVANALGNSDCDKVPLSLPNKMCDTDQNHITGKTVNSTMEKLNNKELSLSLKKDIKQVTENSLNGAASGPKPRNHNTNPDKRHHRKSNLIIGTSKNENKTESDWFMVASQRPRYYNLHLTRVDPSVPVEKISTYIQTNLKTKANKEVRVKLEKLQSRRPEAYSSLKVTTDYEFRDIILDPEFWPNGIAVRPFSKRQPSSSHTSEKDVNFQPQDIGIAQT